MTVEARSLTRRNFMLGGALIATSALAHTLVPRNSVDLLGKRKLEDIIPQTVGPWEFLSESGLVVPPEDELSDQLYSQLLTRVYVARALPSIMLLVAQSPSQDGVLQVHRPEVCYPAGGYALSGRRGHAVPLPGGEPLPATVFSAVSPSRSEQLLYWTRVGSELPTSWADQRLAVARANLRGNIPDAVLVRVSTISPDPAVVDLLDRFASFLLSSVAPAARAVLAGR